MGFVEELHDHMLVADGAMGTLLYAHGVGQCYEALNVSDPDQIRGIHLAYLQAGARLIQTNTYGANFVKLARYGLEDKVQKFNARAVQIGKEALREHGQDGYIFGSVGGLRTPNAGAVSPAEVKRSFREQIYSLLWEGVDGLILETYYDPEELFLVLDIARRETELPIIAQLTLQDIGVVQGGLSVADAFHELDERGATVLGLNCRLGPYHMIRSFEQVPLPKMAYLSAFPNAGLPSYQDGKYQYSPDTDYFREAALSLREQGVRLIGGCCGTTPDHISAVAASVAGKKPVKSKTVNYTQRPGRTHTPTGNGKPDVSSATPDTEEREHCQSLVSDQRYRSVRLQEQAADRTKIVVELDPPKSLQLSRFLHGALALKRAGADALTLADNSLATPRICNATMASFIRQKFNLPSLVHVSCRDRNLIGLQSHLMGLSVQGLHDLLVITGDPARVGDFPGASSVFDVSSFELIRMIKQCNEGLSFSGRSLGQQTSFSVGAAFNPNVRHIDQAVKRMEKKLACGADFFLTQPVYSEELLRNMHEQTRHIQAPVYVGIMPLTGYRNAEFLHHEVPGIRLSDEVRKAMHRHQHDRERAAAEGIAISKQLIDCALEYFSGIYLITPFLRYEMTVELVRYIRSKENMSRENVSVASRRNMDDAVHERSDEVRSVGQHASGNAASAASMLKSKEWS